MSVRDVQMLIESVPSVPDSCSTVASARGHRLPHAGPHPWGVFVSETQMVRVAVVYWYLNIMNMRL